MASTVQINANRANAQKSTGPRTPEGKAVVAQNAVKHGLLAREGVLRGEDPEEFERHRESLTEQLNPVGPLEVIRATRIVDLTWRLQRAAQARSETFGALYDRHTAGAPEPAGPAERGATLGRMILEDYSGEAVLERLLRYERRIEGSLFRNLNELRRVHDQGHKADLEAANTLARWREEDDQARKTRAFAFPRPPDRPWRPKGSATNTPQEVSSAWGQTASLPGLPTSNLTLETAAQPQLCETNPIGSEPDASQVPCSTAVTSDSAPDGLRQTNPICAALCGTGIPSTSFSGQALFVSWGYGQDAHATHGRDAHATELTDRGSTNRPMSQLCETNPIGSESDTRQILSGAGVISDSAPEGRRKTNPICGKVAGLKCEVSNEPGQLCGTNPIPGGADPNESGASSARPSREAQTDFVKQSQFAAKSLVCEGLGHQGAGEEGEGRTPRPSFRPGASAMPPISRPNKAKLIPILPTGAPVGAAGSQALNCARPDRLGPGNAGNGYFVDSAERGD